MKRRFGDESRGKSGSFVMMIRRCAENRKGSTPAEKSQYLDSCGNTLGRRFFLHNRGFAVNRKKKSIYRQVVED